MIKSEAVNKPRELTYPRLMLMPETGTVALVIGVNGGSVEGFVIAPSDAAGRSFAAYCSAVQDFNGTVTLENT